jgi:4-alpha-glucanotransferase
MDTDAWGIADGYSDIAGAWHETSDATRRALRVAMGGHADVADPPPRSRPVWFVRQGTAAAIERPARLVLEDGAELRADARLPTDLPLGYHDLHPSDGGPTTRLIVTPATCTAWDGPKRWGWTVQLYATRSQASWGIGDLADLHRLAAWSAGLGAGFLALNPLHAPLPLAEQEPSPYFPSSRRFRNPLYLRIEEIPGVPDDDPDLAAAGAAARARNADRAIDRDRIHALKLAALEGVWATFGGDARFDRYVAEQGSALHQYAVFCALAEHHGAGWTSWPGEHRRPDSPGVQRFAAAHADRVRFHSWVQWLLDEQLARAGAELPLVADLAVGIDPKGADGWAWQDLLAPGIRVGAPPDAFNAHGQDWGFPPFVPWKLRAAGYEPLAQTVRAALRHAGGIRLDHAMGLFRLYWIAAGGGAADGAYVRYPGTELLDIVALESARAGAFVVGEDLGTVEDQVREHLRDRCVLSYRLFWFEPVPPAQYPEQAFAAITTHDLPTIAGVWSGSDVEEQRRLGLEPDDDAAAGLRSRLEALVPEDATAAAAVLAAHEQLAQTPSVAVSGTLEDALVVAERPNLPGTTTERPNWSLALPVPLEDLEADAGVLAVAAALGTRAAPARKG